MLNSATGVALPTLAEPPMNTIRSRFSVTSGCIRKSNARFVCGAHAINVTFCSDSMMVRRISSTACSVTGSRDGAGNSTPPRPSAPCTYDASRAGEFNGATAPAATGISLAPIKSRIFTVFSTTCLSDTLPATVDTARTSICGLRTAYINAIASSMPVSTSITTGNVDMILLSSTPSIG